jgi:polar amino acid transport system permease protein
MTEFFTRLYNNIPNIAIATGTTVFLSLVAIVLGLLLGLLLALGRISSFKPLSKLCWFYIWLFRGTPLLMQIVFIYYYLPVILQFQLSNYDLYAAFIALGLNSAAYLAEIIRAAIQSIDKGQFEASRALGMPYWLTMKRIIIPQSIRRMIPPVGNEFIMLLKDTSLVSSIGITELLRTGRQMINATGNPMFLIPIALIYLFLTTVFTFIFEKIEKKYSIYE